MQNSQPLRKPTAMLPSIASFSASSQRDSTPFRTSTREGGCTHACEGVGDRRLSAAGWAVEEDTPGRGDARVDIEFGVEKRQGDELEQLLNRPRQPAER
jgi:hypothetical protein